MDGSGWGGRAVAVDKSWQGAQRKRQRNVMAEIASRDSASPRRPARSMVGTDAAVAPPAGATSNWIVPTVSVPSSFGKSSL